MSETKRSRLPLPATMSLPADSTTGRFSPYTWRMVRVGRETEPRPRSVLWDAALSRAVPGRSTDELSSEVAKPGPVQRLSLVAHHPGTPQASRARRFAWLASTALRSVLSSTGSVGLLAVSSGAVAQVVFGQDQTFGPGDVRQTVRQTPNGTTTTIVGNTRLLPPIGDSAAIVNGGRLVFDPAIGPNPGSISSTTANAIGINILGSGTFTVNSGGTFITTTGVT